MLTHFDVIKNTYIHSISEPNELHVLFLQVNLELFLWHHLLLTPEIVMNAHFVTWAPWDWSWQTAYLLLQVLIHSNDDLCEGR